MLRKKHLYQLFALAALALLASCSHLIHLDRAQDNFNRGAELENQLRFSPQPDVSVSPALYYSLAYAELDRALKNKKGLDADKVLGSTYAVKALCEWKLKQYGKAEKSAGEALNAFADMENEGLKMPRDQALMEALPFLIKIDQAKDALYTFHQATPSFEKGKAHYLEYIFDPDPDSLAVLESAIREIGKIQEAVAFNEELSAYFVMAQLAGLKTWSDAQDFLLSCIREDAALEGDANRREKEKARDWQRKQGNDFLEKQKTALLDKLTTLVAPRAKAEELKAYWSEIIGG